METNIVQIMPSVQDMVTNGYTIRHWLQFYKNVWTRQCAAGAIDIQNDRLRKAINPNEMVTFGRDEEVMTVKVRLENRKIALQDGLNVLKAIDALMEIGDDELEAKLFGDDNLKVDDDMLPMKEEATTEAEPAAEVSPAVDESAGVEPADNAPEAEAAVEPSAEAKV